MTPTPHLHALAMRAKAAKRIEQNTNPCVTKSGWSEAECIAFYEGQSKAAKSFVASILALPLEADHAELLREAVSLPEIAALIAAAKKTHIYLGDASLGSLTRALQPFLALETP